MDHSKSQAVLTTAIVLKIMKKEREKNERHSSLLLTDGLALIRDDFLNPKVHREKLLNPLKLWPQGGSVSLQRPVAMHAGGAATPCEISGNLTGRGKQVDDQTATGSAATE